MNEKKKGTEKVARSVSEKRRTLMKFGLSKQKFKIINFYPFSTIYRFILVLRLFYRMNEIKKRQKRMEMGDGE
jgi:hypothetical protein